jgi:circadian clock protein KaiC
MVIKMRGGAHSKDIREYEITSSGLAIGQRLAGYDNVVTGIPQRADRAAPKEPRSKDDR